MRFPEYREAVDEVILSQWTPVSEALQAGRVLSKKDLGDILRENGGLLAVNRLLEAINDGIFPVVTGVPVSVLAITREGDLLDVDPISPLDHDGGKSKLYMDSRIDVGETDLGEAAVRAVTRSFTLRLRSQ